VAYTFTIEQTGGNGIVVPGYGFLLNNELTDFDTASTTAPNRAQGGKRPRSSIAPTIVTRDGRPFMTVGTPGGASIITTVLQILVNRLDFGMSLPDAVAAPRASQRNSATTEAESAFQSSPEGQQLASTYKEAYRLPAGDEIGAATGIEFLAGGDDHGGGNHRGPRGHAANNDYGPAFLAVAEPKRRGGGSAAVVTPAR
jgi:gamma-glutamyltranspeptidase/glutathione hydrolase